jgi:hypothetical protein
VGHGRRQPPPFDTDAPPHPTSSHPLSHPQVGIGETRAERLEALIAIARAHARYGHVQEVIIQNFRWAVLGGFAARRPGGFGRFRAGGWRGCRAAAGSTRPLPRGQQRRRQHPTLAPSRLAPPRRSAKPGTPMAGHPEPPLEELVWTIAAARVILGPGGGRGAARGAQAGALAGRSACAPARRRAPFPAVQPRHAPHPSHTPVPPTPPSHPRLPTPPQT